MISKELLSEVLNIEHILEFRQSVNVFWITDAKSHVGAVPINIYELAHKCKEWALANGFAISSGIPKPFYKKRIIGAEIFKLTDFRNAIFICYQESEYDAIIEACEWILKEHPCNQLT